MFKFIKKAANFFAILGLASLIFISFMMVCNALLRKFLNIYTQGLNDILLMLSVFSIAATAPIMVLKKSSIIVRLVDSFLSPRAIKIVDFIGGTFLAIFLGILALQMSFYSLEQMQNSVTTWGIHLPIWPLWGFTSFMLWFAFIIQIFMLFFAKEKS